MIVIIIKQKHKQHPSFFDSDHAYKFYQKVLHYICLEKHLHSFNLDISYGLHEQVN